LVPDLASNAEDGPTQGKKSQQLSTAVASGVLRALASGSLMSELVSMAAACDASDGLALTKKN
jgi:hypothetical protein